MVRILRAFAWLRFRFVMNALERSGARDTLERFSGAVEYLGPVIILLLMVPTALAMAGLGVAAGYGLAGGATPAVLAMLVRYILFAIPALVVLGPFLLPAADRTNPVRLLLLPIPRSTLYIAQSSSAFGDMWNIFAIPMITGVVIGLAAGGALLGAAVALIAALLLIVALVGLSSTASSLLHLMVRDRRRGELIALLLIVVLPAISILPGALGARMSKRRGGAKAQVERTVNPTLDAVTRTAVSLHPTELFLNAARGAVRRDRATVGRSLTALAAFAALFHMLGFVAFRKVLDSPGSSGSRRGAPMKEVWTRRIPGLSAGASAVALAQLRLAMRTPRGRSIILSPLIVFVVFGVMMWRGGGDSGQMGPFHFTSGIALATVGAFFSVLSILPIAMNQFAVDRAGLTLALLSPLSDRELLAGKAVGNAMVVAPTVTLCILVSRLVFPGDSTALWLALPLGLMAMYFVVAPIAAMASAAFPKVANLNSIGRGGNPHGLANLMGTLALAAGGGIPFALALTATKWFQRPVLALVFVGVWCALAFVVSRLLFGPAARVFRQRRENLAMLE
jgi:hypothetical protein